jgi:hypothetical protein
MTSRSEQQPDDLRRSVRILWSAFGRRADDETCAVWAQSLRAHDGAALRRVFREAAEGESLPTLGEVLGKVRALRRASEERAAPDLTPEQRKRADNSAILSMLWLHYARGWRLQDFSGHVLGRLFGKDPAEALRAAAEVYDRETVLRWMHDQELADAVTLR